MAILLLLSFFPFFSGTRTWQLVGGGLLLFLLLFWQDTIYTKTMYLVLFFSTYTRTHIYAQLYIYTRSSMNTYIICFVLKGEGCGSSTKMYLLYVNGCDRRKKTYVRTQAVCLSACPPSFVVRLSFDPSSKEPPNRRNSSSSSDSSRYYVLINKPSLFSRVS